MSENQTTVVSAFHEAVAAILNGQATPRALWILLSAPTDRDGLWLKPLRWEGPGEYQHVAYADGRDGLVRVPDGALSLQNAVDRARRMAARA
jgi:hypothetical protein